MTSNDVLFINPYAYYAVSGSNFGIVCGAVILLLRLLGSSTRTTVVLGLLVMVGFVILVRPSDSVLRAAIMGGIGLAGALASRRAQALPALGVAIVVMMLVWPQMAVTPGFWLSVLATLGLVLWAAPVRAALVRRRVPELFAVLMAMTLAAQILTTPVVILISGQLSVVSVLANVVVAPVVGIIALLGTAAAVLGGVPGSAASAFAGFLLRATTPEMWWLTSCADVLGGHWWSAPHVPPVPTALIMITLGVTAWLVVKRRRQNSDWRIARAARQLS